MSYSTTLYYREGPSDKVYQASIVATGNQFNVSIAYGRRGSTLQTGTKNVRPVSFEEARQLYEKVVREKKAKGYTEGPDGTPYRNSAEAGRVSPYLPQLLNPIAEEQLEPYLRDPRWALQQKHDGKRLLVWKEGERLDGINRRGLLIGLPEPLFQELLKVEGDFVLDGEMVGLQYHVFDLLRHAGNDLRALPYRKRLGELILFLPRGECLRVIETDVTPPAKRERLEQIKFAQHEGVVLKDLDAPYTAGRPNSGGPQLKCKFYATATFVVGAINPQRSVLLTLRQNGEFMPTGNVTVPPNQPMPKVGDVLAVRYLYAFAESHAVYQPTLIGIREDLVAEDCTLDQLEYKPAAEDGV